MKKLFIMVAAALLMVGCDKESYEPQFGESYFRALAEKCCEEAYGYHCSLALDDWDCEESPCGWDYVNSELRQKYESGARMSTEELAVIAQQIIERYPDYADTLGEGDTFYAFEVVMHQRTM